MHSTKADGWNTRISSISFSNKRPLIATHKTKNAHDPFITLLRSHTIFLSGEINDSSSDAVIGQLLMLDSQKSGATAKIFINSPGGSVTAGMAIYDSMTTAARAVATVCVGLAASMGAFILGAGEPGKRYSMLNSRIMIHQPIGGITGAAVDVEIQVG
eukprot:gnl/MRDRNA2_/MRDRNA2_86748_c0_seq1.p2 gnl/MRDRNA2_/MRDRNA2_86748_c0~~gnl/MRDRNA2_/MRDRNA2_86748_c0_seq1.p2  ORF type:complete len:158 (-),score=8.11 gnl/MRDRNA2_/MRDRNA2_86748_c0_seq1:503-976(-)